MKGKTKVIADLPDSNDEFWDGDKYKHTPVAISICQTHSISKYLEHRGYVNRHDGTVGCIYCPWGALLPGYLKVIEGRLIKM